MSANGGNGCSLRHTMARWLRKDVCTTETYAPFSKDYLEILVRAIDEMFEQNRVKGVLVDAMLRNPKTPCFRRGLNGGARRDRTDDLYNAIVALSQLSYGPVALAACWCGAPKFLVFAAPLIASLQGWIQAQICARMNERRVWWAFLSSCPR